MASDQLVGLSDLIHPDIIRSHILSRLDGPSLASAASASSELRALSGDDALWQDACAAVWPSVASLGRLISGFPSGHRSFFSDAFPGVEPGAQYDPAASAEAGLISAVDIFYEGKAVLSRVKEMETGSEWSRGSPFAVEVLEAKESVATGIPGAAAEEEWVRQLEERVRVRWVVIDAAGGRAADVSSGRAVRAERHWLTGEVELRYSTVMAGRGGGRVLCTVAVTCGRGEDGGTQVAEVGMHVEDLEGRHVSGRESVAVLANALRGPRRRRRERERLELEEYLGMRRQARAMRQRREQAIDLACLVTGLSIFFSFCYFILV